MISLFRVIQTNH